MVVFLLKICLEMYHTYARILNRVCVCLRVRCVELWLCARSNLNQTAHMLTSIFLPSSSSETAVPTTPLPPSVAHCGVSRPYVSCVVYTLTFLRIVVHKHVEFPSYQSRVFSLAAVAALVLFKTGSPTVQIEIERDAVSFDRMCCMHILS